ncbi:MAG: D-glycerate dehydrogenase [Solirubrobacterales bacterium]|nr:D-glycerate dehydrogenase [Solirubrobacterales bacterium]
MKVLASVRFPGPAFDELTDVELLDAPLPDALNNARSDVGALAVVHEVIDERTLELLPSLELVANYGVGYDGIDVAACLARGVTVTNTPGVIDGATADLALALMLAVRRRVVEGDTLIRHGTWPSGTDRFLGAELTGATLGVVGFGRVGRAVARRARGFDMRVLYTKRRRLELHEEEALGVEFRELDELLGEAEIVSLHVPLAENTRHLIDARRLSLLSPGACLVNTARGEIVDEEALITALEAGRITAGLDVFSDEPSVPARLLGMPQVVLTPHIGSATATTRAAMTRLLVDNILAAASGRPLPTPVPA